MTPEEIWLEYEKIPIKWQYPLGVIVDSLGIDLKKGPIPFYVHVRNIPKDKVLTYEGLDTLKKYYFAAIKEANMIKFPKEQKILNLDLDDTKLLNEIINSNQRNLIVDFRKVMNKVHSNSIIEKYPVRLIFNKTDLIITKPVNVPNEKINTYTLKNYLIDVFGEELYNLLKEKTKIIIHGLEIEEQISFLFYYLNFSYMDNFLYIVFYEKS
jgi:autophagy-related protein 5